MGKQPILCNDPLLTQQSAKDECDINIIVNRAKQGADLSQQMRPVMYGDLIGFPDFRESLVMVTKANEMFMSLDAEIRKRFSNDPAKLLDFLSDDKNREEGVKLGLLKAPEVAPPTPAPSASSEAKK